MNFRRSNNTAPLQDDEENQRPIDSSSSSSKQHLLKPKEANDDDDEDDDDQGESAPGSSPSTRSSSGCSIPPILFFAVPGAIYFFNNNLTFVLLALMPAPTYVVLSNLKILTTGLFSYLFLHRLLSPAQWVSLAILFLSTAVSQIDLERGLTLSISLQAFLLMVLFCSLSAAASVFSEYVMKERFAKESIHLQNMKLYMFGILFNGITYVLTPSTTPAAEGGGFFSDMAPIHVLIIMAYASLGLVTSAIIKFSGSITKVYASSMSMFFAALVSWLLLNDRLTVLFFIGCFGCCFALHLYYRAPSVPKDEETATNGSAALQHSGRDSTSSATSSTTLAISPVSMPSSSSSSKGKQNPTTLSSVKVMDRNEYISLDTMDDDDQSEGRR
ncbi:nucleotide-sugar transporter-domain-containing protein [Gamsiella multidivaricata]|uniref:nucleotide-sugar transporter-domain-containing protein n=1 Tax=Gamsiella multidivaricata TaxID=101098 RepID=UPI002220E123|nr:nucleotide-sugar transporter-domain-containing protein [Gamsiella multidivaricata]KAI7820273.1 nucleotide-sugar transporter-domain-containing protein [Gamsiella multidivaricata]